MPEVLTGTYRTRESALRAAERLLEAGFTRDEVCLLLAPEDSSGSHFAVKTRTAAMEGMGGGAILGLVLGAIAGLVHGLFVLPIQGLEFMLDQPLFVAAMMGAGAGAAAGAFFGMVIGLFYTHHEAVIKSGTERDAGFMLVGVTAPRNMARSAAELLEVAGASKVTRG